MRYSFCSFLFSLFHHDLVSKLRNSCQPTHRRVNPVRWRMIGQFDGQLHDALPLQQTRAGAHGETSHLVHSRDEEVHPAQQSRINDFDFRYSLVSFPRSSFPRRHATIGEQEKAWLFDWLHKARLEGRNMLSWGSKWDCVWRLWPLTSARMTVLERSGGQTRKMQRAGLKTVAPRRPSTRDPERNTIAAGKQWPSV